MATKLSEHFTREELACHHCGRCDLHPLLVPKLELLRAAVGRPLRVVSGFRCVVHNRQVGGARRSRHLLGEAVDVEAGYCTVPQAEAAGFRGIGVCRGKVVHIDMRPGQLVVFQDC